MSPHTSKRIAILATNGFEQSELLEPKTQLSDAGFETVVISPEKGSITGWNEKNWGESVDVDLALADAKVEDFDALVLPGGQINPDLLRVNDDAVRFVRAFAETGKPVAAICHAPWLLIEADLVHGKKLTSYKSIQTDMRNAGANWVDEEVAQDGNLITSRNPGDLDAFCAAVREAVQGVASRERAAS